MQITGYDGAPAIYSALLSKDQTYSSALWPTHLGGPRGDLLSPERTLGDLESAQLEKINYILDQARVKAGSRLLEFGSGWGALAIEAARRGADVDTLTLSVEQQAGAQARIKALGLQGRIRVHLLDYRQTPTIFTKGSFDAFVAVEMIEVSLLLFC
jgi:cyclopropane-fatty-acyl-phospholipid synthase